MRRFLSNRVRWWALALAWVIVLVLGVAGFVTQSRALDLDHTFLDHLYFTLKLMTMDFAGASTPMNWQLEVARFVAPAIAAGTVLQSASSVFRDQFVRWRVGFLRAHTVVIGLGPAGIRLARALQAAGRTVVAVEPDPSSPGAATARDLDIPVVTGDPGDAGVLRAVRVDRAAMLVAIAADDATNVAVAAAASGLERRSKVPLRCAVHLTDTDLVDLLRGVELNTDRPVRLEFFNLHERAARVMLEEHPVAGTAAATDGAHLVVLGLGQVGRHVVLAAAQQWAERGDGRLRVTVVDKIAEGRLQALLLQHPALAAAIDPHPIEMDLDAPGSHAARHLEEVLVARPPTLTVVALEQQALAWSTGLLVRRIITSSGAEVIVRIESDGGLGRMLGAALGRDQRRSIVTFPIFERACTAAAVEGGVREQLARAIHEDHVDRSGSGAALHRPWDELSDTQRESSRAAADGIAGQLSSLGIELVPMQRWEVDDHPFTEDEVDQLAAAEHARWKAEREADGWTWGEVRDDERKRNPLLVDWARLPPDAKSWNVEATEALPGLVARAGLELQR